MSKPYVILNKDSKTNTLLIAEHTSSEFPKTKEFANVNYAYLKGIPDYYDIGAEKIIVFLARKFQHTAIHAKYSRLLIDLNRSLEHEQLIRYVEDDKKKIIHFNQDLSEEQKLERIELYWKPFHNMLKKIIRNKLQNFETVFAFPIHSCFPEFAGKKRDFEIDLLFNKDEGLAKAIGKALKSKGYDVKYNHPPFSGIKNVFTMNQFNEERLRWVFFEINNKILQTPEHIYKVSEDIGLAIQVATKTL